MSDPFIAATAAAGLAPVKAIDLADGKLVRFRVEGDKAGSRNGWAVLHHHPIPAGAFGSWKTGEHHTWKATSNETMTPAERAELQRKLQAAQRLRLEEEARVRAAAAARAAKLWSGAKPATDDHPYLRAKGVHAFGLRALRDQLMVPARDADGRLHTLQFIGPDGAKKFLTGGRTKGVYFAIGRPSGVLLVGEGYATCASIYQATGHAVAVAFNSGNLVPVAQALRAKFPHLKFVICADNDAETEAETGKNPGLMAAHQAARAIGAAVAYPSFEGAAHG